jgi:FkbM family methyltransferase
MKTLLRSMGCYDTARTLWLRLRKPKCWKHERDKQQIFANCVPKGSLCFDIGANIGEYTDDLLLAGAGRVVAVEPQTNCLDQLHEKFDGDGRVSLIPSAVGPAQGTITMHTSDASQIGSCAQEWLEAVKSSGRFAGHDWTTTVEVPMTTLDKLIATHGRPVFCKIDVEGFELDVLRGLTTPIARMSFEFSPETMARTCDCVEHLSRIGDYRFNYCAHGHYTYGLTERLPYEGFREVLRELPAQAMKWGGDIYAWSRN